jgi:hypothetical protein
MYKASASAREHWRQIIEQQKRSGLSVARFCRDHQVGASSLFAWKRRLAREAEAVAAPAFVAVTSAAVCDGGVAMNASDGAIELHLGDGRHLLLRPGFDVATLAAALAVLADSTPEGR